jgi:hypothetical protein
MHGGLHQRPCLPGSLAHRAAFVERGVGGSQPAQAGPLQPRRLRGALRRRAAECLGVGGDRREEIGEVFGGSQTMPSTRKRAISVSSSLSSSRRICSVC